MFAFLSPTILLVAVSWGFSFRARLAVDVDHLLIAQEVIGALREAGIKEASSAVQGRTLRAQAAAL